jgi:hypothetical protein
MPEGVASVVEVVLGAYLLLGILFALPFTLFKGIARLDPAAAAGSLGFRLLAIPGSVALWPVLLRKWLGARHGGVEEA